MAVSPPPTARKRRLLFFVTEDWYFCSHRLPLAVAARNAGFEVTVVTRVSLLGDTIRRHGIHLIPVPLQRRGRNPFRELLLVARLFHIYRTRAPDIVHQVALKPVLYGSVAARLAGVGRVVNALAGLGFLFSSDRPLARVLRPWAKLGFRLLLNRPGTRVILQNPDDARLLQESTGLEPVRSCLIRGSGVDLETFVPHPEPAGPPLVMLPARLLWDKGVGEFVAAARSLRRSGVDARFVLVGEPDPGNPAAVPDRDLLRWQASGAVEYWGRKADMPWVLAQAHIVCLPSWREGLPKVLLEAAACGRPIVTTDAPGCREVVRDGENGLLVPLKDAAALAAAIGRLIHDPELRRRLGACGREIAEAEFGIERVVEQTLALYRELL